MMKKYDVFKNQDLPSEQRLAILGIESKPLMGTIIASTFITKELIQNELNNEDVEKLKTLLFKIETATNELKKLSEILVK